MIRVRARTDVNDSAYVHTRTVHVFFKRFTDTLYFNCTKDEFANDITAVLLKYARICMQCVQIYIIMTFKVDIFFMLCGTTLYYYNYYYYYYYYCIYNIGVPDSYNNMIYITHTYINVNCTFNDIEYNWRDYILLLRSLHLTKFQILFIQSCVLFSFCKLNFSVQNKRFRYNI